MHETFTQKPAFFQYISLMEKLKEIFDECNMR